MRKYQCFVLLNTVPRDLFAIGYGITCGGGGMSSENGRSFICSLWGTTLLVAQILRLVTATSHLPANGAAHSKTYVHGGSGGIVR